MSLPECAPCINAKCNEFGIWRFARFLIWRTDVTLVFGHFRCLADGAQEFLQKPLKVKDLEKLRSHVWPAVPAPKMGTKRKVLIDMMPESSEAERRPCPAGVAVA